MIMTHLVVIGNENEDDGGDYFDADDAHDGGGDVCSDDHGDEGCC